MTIKSSNLQAVGSYKALDQDCDPLTAQFEIVTGHKKGFLGYGQCKEVVETTTYPDLMRKIAAMPENSADTNALRNTAAQIEPTLDFTDEWGDMTYGVMSGMR